MATQIDEATTPKEQLQQALDAAENVEARYHIRETLQKLHVGDE